MSVCGIDIIVNGVIKKTMELTYEDIVWLCKDFYNKNNKYPSGHDFCIKNNLPQQRIVSRLIKERGLTYADFWNSLGKTKHVRAEIENYDIYIHKFKEYCNKNHVLTSRELFCNKLGLPSYSWFVENCPDKNVKNYSDFLKWCGYNPNIIIYEKEYISQQLINYEKELNRAIKREDITCKKIGFSLNCINRIWGSLYNCRKELNLKEPKLTQLKTKSFLDIKNNLDGILDKIKNEENRVDILLVEDISKTKYDEFFQFDLKSYVRKFHENNMDLKQYIINKGFRLIGSGCGINIVLRNGEHVRSILEYYFTGFLMNELNLKYNKDYFRDVQYKYFTNTNSRMNCDYLIKIRNKYIYVEIAGILNECNALNWESYFFEDEFKTRYQDSLKRKKQLLDENNCDYVFLFPCDIESKKYKNIIKYYITKEEDYYED